MASRSLRRPVRRATLSLGVGLIVAACGGGGTAVETVPPTPVPQTASPTTVASTTAAPTTSATTPEPVVETAPSTEPPVTEPSGPVFPLTGLPIDDDTRARQPAIVVKIDNVSAARPQSGLGSADIVFEEIVEGATRLFAVFHSRVPETIGPIRSGRTQDVDIATALNRPLFVWSGGNRTVANAIAAAPVVNVNAQFINMYNAAGFYRASGRKAPHNLYAKGADIAGLAPFDSLPPEALFDYRPDGIEPLGIPQSTLRVDMLGSVATWTWEPTFGMYLRAAGSRAHKDADGAQIAAANVVVLVTKYRASPADRRSPEAQTVGEGPAIVVTGGNVVFGRWLRLSADSGWTLVDDQGEPILLTPGPTWVELAEDGDTTIE